MQMPRKALVSWSSGKDAALALLRGLNDPLVKITGLFTTVTEGANRVGIHETPLSLVTLQAEALGFPLHVVQLPPNCPNSEYELRVRAELTRFASEGINKLIFGDLYLEDIRAYREQLLEGTGITGHFPLWKLKTHDVARDILDSGIQAMITTIDSAKLPETCLGRRFDLTFLEGLPAGVDPCGENGEFHTFVFNSPGFQRPIQISKGEIFKHHGHLKSIVIS